MTASAKTETGAVLERLLALHPKLIDLHLGRMERLLAALGHPEKGLAPVFHVAGTNGKGSAVAGIRAILEAGGRSVHVYTSPHLVRFHERIVLNGVPISEERLLGVLEACEAANGGESITYFEITTCAALLAFSQHPADGVILEVGLGGRLDATNVVDRPTATVIMPVDYDHQEFLGPDLKSIAGEKAGILKPGVPGIIARQQDEALEVIRQRAEDVGAPLLIFGQDFMTREEHGRLIYEDENGLLDLPLPRLLGRHQIENAGAAIAATRVQKDVTLPENAWAGGMTEMHWPGRLQRLTKGPLCALVTSAAAEPANRGEIWLDGGHNPHAGRAIAQTMADLDQRVPRRLYLITGMMKNKDQAGFFAAFDGLARHVVGIPIPGQDNGAVPDDVAQAAGKSGLPASSADSLKAGMDRVLQMAHEDGDPAPRILICGSLYLAGHVLADHR